LAVFNPDFGSQFGKFGSFGTREIYRHYAPIFTRFADIAGGRLFGHLGQPQVGPSADPILAIWDPILGSPNPIFGSSDPIFGSPNPILGSPDPILGVQTPFLTLQTPFWGPGPHFGVLRPLFGVLAS
jgi:hypothetical protein